MPRSTPRATRVGAAVDRATPTCSARSGSSGDGQSCVKRSAVDRGHGAVQPSQGARLEMPGRPRGKLKRRLHLLTLSRNDFAAAQDAAEFLATTHGFRPTNALCHAIHAGLIAAYGRPFKVNDDLGTLRGELDRYDDSRMKRMHADLIALRDKTIAHNDAS